MGKLESVDYVQRAGSKKLADLVRERRRKALEKVSQIWVRLEKDGAPECNLVFDQPPTLRELSERASDDMVIVSIETRRRERIAQDERPLMLTRRVNAS